jgi:hypothetical protein
LLSNADYKLEGGKRIPLPLKILRYKGSKIVLERCHSFFTSWLSRWTVSLDLLEVGIFDLQVSRPLAGDAHGLAPS